ncbi:serine-rich adhesin for platelets isoform X1 [Lucilia sericata]|uniref:serine-rich adhesin for platelets isoform X1 n=1 Tax=Lucilia sericata TaxID=13632 RepID=UPI0018A84BC2|nr:serine-rich adhesin for platelets isoform X1 [Lucilia sericata]
MSADIEITSVLGTNGQPLPIHGTGLGSTWSAPVKQERADDAEIQELAAKMKEAQKDALAKQQQQAAQMALRQANGMQPPVTANGQTNILNYLNRTQKPTNGSVTSNGRSSSTDDNKKPPCDEESQKGHFGWTTFGKTYIPYIYRQQEKYCSVRMIEMKLLGKYLNCLHPDIYSSCTCVRSYYITEAEARLFIEINHKHCDGEFGRDLFTQKDLVVRLSDATKFYQFLDICYRKLISGSKSPSEKCGFIRINKESVVPYTVRNGEQVVPLFYFEGETENLKQKADLLSGWDLAYLKFCCKVQGIRNELFSSENVAVISLTDIKSYFPNGTEFEDYWPSKVVDSNLLIGNRSNANNSVNWTRQPSQPPPKVLTQTTMQQKQTQHSSAAAAAAAAAAQQQQILKRGPTAAAVAAATAFNAQSLLQQPNAAAAAAAHRMHSNAALAAQAATVQAIANGSWMSQQQNSLPLIHAQMLASQQAHQNQAAANSRNQYRNPMENLILNNRQPYGAYNNATISMQPVNSHGQGNAPPPLVRSAGQQNANHMSSIEQTLLQQQQTQQQQQQRPNSSNSSQTLNQQQQRHINTSLNPIHSPNSLNNLKQSPSPSTPSPSPLAAASNANALLANNFNLAASSAPATAQDFNNLALWNQLTPSQRLALTQQFKNSGNLLGGGAGIKNPFPPLPSLPLDTDLITMLDYNPNKAKQQGGSANASNNGQFTKPHVPPLIPVNNLEPQRKGNRSGSVSNAAAGTVPLNSSAALEDFEKKFKMNDEMRAVVQKVLSNPDLSTFIQTNASNTFVPFISPPISPANGVLGGAASGGTSVSIVPNPHVTITPQLPAHFSHSSAAHSPSSASSTSSNSGGNNRQKSVICSTNNLGGGATSLLPSPSTSNSSSSSSSSSHSPSTRTKLTAYQHHHQQNTYASPTQTQLSSNSSSTTPTPMEVIDLSSPRRSLQAATAYLQQQQQQQQQQAAAAAAAQQQSQQRLAAAAVAQHHSQQNGRSSSNSSASSQVNSASMHLQRHALAAAAAADSAQRLNVIPEIPANNLNMQPYKVQKVYVENKLVPCINMKAYNDSEQLMTLTDFQTYFYRQVPLDQCKRLIEALGVELYKGNRHQLKVLMEHDPQHNENIPLVQVRDILKYMTQLTFMIRNQEQPPNKRSRIS